MRSGETSRLFSADEVAKGVVFAVADGVGGANAGDEASEFVINALGRALADLPEYDSFTDVSRDVQEIAASVNRELRMTGQRRPGRSGMSTTYTALVFRKETAFWINAGDSRLYHVVDGTLRQITRDHTLREMTGDDRIPGNIIVNCFGTEHDFYTDLGGLGLSDAEAYLLCSDGLSDYVDHAEMERIAGKVAGSLSGRSPVTSTLEMLRESGKQLVAAAKEGGGGDNITLLLCRPVCV